MTEATVDPNLYRAAAAAVIFNPRGSVWLGRRASETRPNIWQYPQGGIDENEKPLTAAIREIEEETGIDSTLLKSIGHINAPLFYDLPVQYKTTARTKKWQGQKQYWFAFEFMGNDADVNLENQNPPEFSTWKWGDIHDAVNTVIDFKRDIYARVAKEFEPFAKRI